MPIKKYKTKETLEEQHYELIMQHIHDPERSPLPAPIQAKYNRCVSAAKMLDTYHPTLVVTMLQEKYNISRNTAYGDIRLAQELFKSQHTFDWDYWQQWQIKDLVDTIRMCKAQNKARERVMAHKVLREIIGEKTVTAEDPKRMEANTFYIQINNNQNTINIPLNKLKGLSANDIQTVIESINTSNESDEDILNILS